MTASEYYDETTAAAQYFMDMASHTGIPIIAWNADNSGMFINKVFPFEVRCSLSTNKNNLEGFEQLSYFTNGAADRASSGRHDRYP